MTLLGPVSLWQTAAIQTVIPFPQSRGFVTRPLVRLRDDDEGGALSIPPTLARARIGPVRNGPI